MKKDFYAVGIGASAGGLPALTDFFNHISSDINVAFVIVNHLMRDYRSPMDEIPNHTSMPVIHIEEDVQLKPGRVYVLTEDTTITIKEGLIRIQPHSLALKTNTIDIFLESLAKDFKEKSVGIILSGSGSDGLEGARAIANSGGKVMVQDPSSAEMSGMPLSVINYDHPNRVMKPAELAKLLSDSCSKRQTHS